MSVYVQVLVPAFNAAEDYKLDLTITNEGPTKTGIEGEPRFQGDYTYRCQARILGREGRTFHVVHYRDAGIERLVAKALMVLA